MRDQEKTKSQLIGELAGLRRRVEELEADARFRTFVEKMPDTILYNRAFDEPNTLLYVSPQVEKILGYTIQELSLDAGGCLPYVHPEDQERVSTEFKHCHQTGRQFSAEYRVIKADGEVAWVHDAAGLLRDESGSPTAIIGVSFDIGPRKSAEEALRASEARYRSIYENAAEGIFQTTPEGRYLSINPAFARMFGYPTPEDMMETISDIGGQVYVHSQDRERLKKLLAEEGRVEGFEVQVYRRNGGIIWISINARAVRDTTGAILFFEGTNADIDNRKRAEEELEKKSLDLEETNTALRVLLRRHEEDRREFAAGVLSNLRELVFPYLERIEESALNDLQRTYLRVVASHLEEIGAPFLRTLSREFENLSRTERRIASLIKEGKLNKEIAEIMGVSVNTILTHRYHLRTKLGLKNKKVNLISYLKSVSSA